MRKKRISFETLGCRYNRYESAEMAHELEKAGFTAVEDSGPADVVVINTCAVTSKSAARCRAAIRNAKGSNPDARIVVTGCYSEVSPEDVSLVEGVDIVLGNAEKFDIAGALKRLDSPGGGSMMVGGSTPDTLPVRSVLALKGRTNAYLNVQSGCDEVCSFCVVRLARGKSRSAEALAVVDQVEKMSGAGIKEVVLTGINIGQYGKNMGVTLTGLMKKILDGTGMERIRLSSINPNDVTDELIELIANSPRVCPHLHIPLQSGSGKILKMMRRPYSAGEYEALLNTITERVPECGLGADVMVGFPGEGEKEYGETLSLIERLPLMMLHVFVYSPRDKTEAGKMTGAVSRPVAKQRSAALKKLSADKGMRFRNGFVGRSLDVLIENKRDAAGMLKGFSDNYLPVAIEGSDELMNRIVPIRVTGEQKGRLLGKAI